MVRENQFERENMTGERGVTPVIGVMLLVAITVILVGVVGVTVLGLVDGFAETQPTVSFEFSENGSHVDVRHMGGDSLSNDSVSVFVNGSVGTVNPGFDSVIRAGSTATVRDVPNNARVTVTWIGNDRSAVLAEYVRD